MLPLLVPSGCMPMLWGFFSNDDPGLTSCISKFVLIQNILSTQVSDTVAGFQETLPFKNYRILNYHTYYRSRIFPDF